MGVVEGGLSQECTIASCSIMQTYKHQKGDLNGLFSYCPDNLGQVLKPSEASVSHYKLQTTHLMEIAVKEPMVVFFISWPQTPLKDAHKVSLEKDLENDPVLYFIDEANVTQKSQRMTQAQTTYQDTANQNKSSRH